MRKYLAMFGLFMGAIFIFVGISMMFFDPAPVQQWLAANQYPPMLGKVAGFLVFVYGMFRLFRSIKTLKNPQNQQ